MSEQREAPRRRVCFGGRIVHEHAHSDTACILRDLSRRGARLRVSGTVPLPHRFDLVVDRHEALHRVELVWRRGDALGVRFLSQAPESEAERIAALRESLRASRLEASALRERLTAIEANAAGETRH